ncbi:MAG: T9SS type A sorting domain-containing protein [bacterium]
MLNGYNTDQTPRGFGVPTLTTAVFLVIVAILVPEGNAYADVQCTASASLTGHLQVNARLMQYRKYYGSLVYSALNGTHVYCTGLARFDISAIPDSASIISVTLRYHQYSRTYSPRGDILLVEDITASAESVAAQLGRSVEVSPASAHVDGWNSRSLNQNGLRALESLLTRGFVDLAIVSGDAGSAHGYSTPRDVRPHLIVQYELPGGQVNAKLTSIAYASFPPKPGEEESVRVTITNLGDTTATDVWVYCSVPGSPLDSQCIAAVAPSESVSTTFRFTGLQAEASVSITCHVSAASDLSHADDTADINFWVFPAAAVLSEGFEPYSCPTFPPSGWRALGRWRRNTELDLWQHSGRYHAYAYYQEGSASNEWLFTPMLFPDSRTADTLGFFYRSRPSYHDYMQVWALDGQDPADTLALLLDRSFEPTAWIQARFSLDDFDGDSVCIGLRKYLSPYSGVCIDDLWCTSALAPGVAEGGPALPRTGDRLTAFPSPARSAVTLRWTGAASSDWRIAIHDMAGRLVREVRDPAGDGAGGRASVRLPAGVYVARATSGKFTSTARFVVTR